MSILKCVSYKAKLIDTWRMVVVRGCRVGKMGTWLKDTNVQYKMNKFRGLMYSMVIS